MNRFVILVDAGYLFASAGDLCFGTAARRHLSLDPGKVTAALVDICEKHSGQQYLRTYWYDAAVDALPTAEQNDLADQRGLKLRLGRMVHGGQKGVDSRIVRDLIVLPRNGAVGTIYLMSGDEDVREGVIEAQELGVSVVLLGIEPLPGKSNQAQTLIREADDRIILPRSECERFLSDVRRSAGVAVASPPATPIVTGSPPLGPSVAAQGVLPADAEEFGRQYAAAWKANNDAASLATLVAGKPKVPISIDGPLMRAATAQFRVSLGERDRRALRKGFWEEIGRS